MWNIKKRKQTHKTKQKLIDMNRRLVITRKKVGWEVGKMGKGDQMYG